MNTYRAGVSLCMIVRDEERFLDGALRSVGAAVDEICIVDTGSTDGTLAIARAYGARVVEVAWQDDFAAARNAALALATRRWIFVLDADERLAQESLDRLARFAHTPAGLRGGWIRCRNLTDDYKGSGAMTNALVRLFPNDPRIRYRNALHEFVTLDGSDGGLAADPTGIEIVHHGYLSAVVRERKKADRNVRLSRIAAEHDPADAFAQYNLGMALLLAGDRDGAIGALDGMRERTRSTPRGYRIHGLVVLAELYADHRRDLETALGLVHECLTLVPNYSNAQYVLGKLLVRAGDLFAARDAFGRAIAAGQHNAEQFVVDDEIAVWKAHSEIGATLMREARYAQALAWFELAARARPGAQPLVINRAKCHEALGDVAAARALFAAAFVAYADEMSSIEWINFLLRSGANDEAFDAIERALALVTPECRPLLLGTAAAAHLRAGCLDRAQFAVDRALACDDPAAAAATLDRLAVQLKMNGLRGLLSARPQKRANDLRIAYAQSR